MTNNPISKLLRLVMLLAAVLLLLSSCRQDDDSYSSHPGPTTLVSLSVSASNSGAVAASDDPASSIRDLCILQFNVNGTGFGNLRHVAKGSPASAGTFNATLLQSVNPDDKYKLVLLANLPDYGFLNSLSGKSYDQVQKTLIERLFSGGSKSFPAFPLRVVYMSVEPVEEDMAAASILISVPKKRFKRAVKRNLVKRQVREAYRKNKHLLLDALASRNKRLIIAFIWLDNHIHSSAEVEEKVKKLLFHIVERLE